MSKELYTQILFRRGRLLTRHSKKVTTVCGERGLICGRQVGDWFFHHDNVPAHTTLSVRQFLTKDSMTPVPHLLYSTDLTPCDFFISPNKRSTKKKAFCRPDDVKKRQRRCQTSKKMNLKNVLPSGIKNWTNASVLMENASKKIYFFCK